MKKIFRKRKIFSRKNKQKKRLLVVLAVFLFSSPAWGALAYQRAYRGRVFPGVRIGDVRLGGKNAEEILVDLTDYTQRVEKAGLSFMAESIDGESGEASVGTMLWGVSDPDLSRTILSFDFEKTVALAMEEGRRGNLLEKIQDRWEALAHGRRIRLQFKIDEDEFDKILKEEFSSLEKPPVNASLKLVRPGLLAVLPEKMGYAFDYPRAVKEARAAIGRMSLDPVRLVIKENPPKIRREDSLAAVDEAYEILEIAPISVKYDGRWASISRQKLEGWLVLESIENENVGISLNKDKAEEFLRSIAENVDYDPVDARFVMKDGKVVEFRPSRNGRMLDIREGYGVLAEEIVENRKNRVELAVREVEPKVSVKDINEFGIKELLGTGISDFSGSPQNRRHNIATGAEKLSGMLIEPDEEFSVIRSLGEIDAESGYLPELVIKKDRTVPEYGGGLCQIGTTVFRVALDAGLPVTRRRPHSYRVSYYEPAGTDATIYNPDPDLRFVNDTGSHMMVLAKISGNELKFELWGTADGRKVEITDPEITNITDPGPPRYIETQDLEPGKKKRIEIAHKGADAQFERTITYPDGNIEEETWKSHYVPWQEVWLIGKEPESDDSGEAL